MRPAIAGPYSVLYGVRIAVSLFVYSSFYTVKVINLAIQFNLTIILRVVMRGSNYSFS